MGRVNREQRERIATACLQGLITWNQLWVTPKGNYLEEYADEAVRYADALIKALEEER